MQQKSYPREILVLAVFGGFWGVTESTLGTFFHLIHLPFVGLLLSLAGMFIVLNAARFYHHRGAIILMGIVAALVKAIAISSVKLGPIIGIMSEAVVIEAVVMLFQFGFGSFLICGVLVATIPMVIQSAKSQ